MRFLRLPLRPPVMLLVPLRFLRETTLVMRLRRVDSILYIRCLDFLVLALENLRATCESRRAKSSARSLKEDLP